MIVRCPSCEARFHLADGRLPDKGARVRCSKCHHRFYVRPPDADARGAQAELEAQSEPDAAPVPRKPAPPAEKRPAKTAPAPAKSPAPTAAKPARPPAPPKPAPKPVAATPAQASGADDPDLEDPQFLFDTDEPPPARPPARATSGASDALGSGAALFSADDEEERAEATLGDEEAFADPEARSDLFGDMAGLAAEVEASEKKVAPAAPSPRVSAALREDLAPPSTPEPAATPSLEVTPGRSGGVYQGTASREQVERKVAPSSRPAARAAAEPPAASQPRETPRTRLLSACACAVAVALLIAGGRLVASHATGALPGPERQSGPGWEVRGVHVLRLRAADGQRVLAVRGTLERTGSGSLPSLRAVAADASGEPLGNDAPVSWTWLDDPELTPERLRHWIVAAPTSAPAGPGRPRRTG